jgi:hypothetical protein
MVVRALWKSEDEYVTKLKKPYPHFCGDREPGCTFLPRMFSFECMAQPHNPCIPPISDAIFLLLVVGNPLVMQGLLPREEASQPRQIGLKMRPAGSSYRFISFHFISLPSPAALKNQLRTK